MKQIVQHQRNGELVLEEVPVPLCHENGVLVQVVYSLISAGTEKNSVDNARGSFIERAKKQPEQVKLVLDTLKQQGIVSTYNRVWNKLNSFKPLGYSASGIVVESKCNEFKRGNRVSVGGAGIANHGEFVSVPKNLAVLIPENVSFADASYGTVGSIAMQGVRQANVSVGETVGVIGLGLLGLITVQILKGAGCRVIGFDINEDLFADGYNSGADLCLKNTKENLEKVKSFSNGIGLDSVIITAGTSSSEPLNLSFEMTRKRGVISIVGAVGLNIDRGKWYRKEIDVKISCSYGPGRYDPSYEDFGNDYPIAYVRWTEKRNIESIIDLISRGILDVNKITTHSFNLSNAVEAYNLILTGNEKYLGIVINFGDESKTINRYIFTEKKLDKKDDLSISFIGLGQFAQNYLVPPLKNSNVNFYGVCNSSPLSSKSAANVNDFELSSSDPVALIYDKKTDVVFIATEHSKHGEFVLQSLNAHKPVYCEKPLCVSKDDLEEIRKTIEETNGRVMVGFNRRFSDIFKFIKNDLKNTTHPISISYRVNAGLIPKEHWVQNNKNKGRIIGEVCHFVDTLIFLTGSIPIRVYAECISSNNESIPDEDVVTISIKFRNGSIGRIDYYANGGKSMEKEYCEVFSSGVSYKMLNFETLEIYKTSNVEKKKFSGKKGIDEEIQETISAIKNGYDMPISFEEIYYNTLTTFGILDSLNKSQAINIV